MHKHGWPGVDSIAPNSNVVSESAADDVGCRNHKDALANSHPRYRSADAVSAREVVSRAIFCFNP